MKASGRYLAVVAAMCGLAAATVGLITNVAGLFFGPMAEEFGVMQGAAAGAIGFVLINYVLGKWFVAQLGIATSVAMGCSGLAGALFSHGRE